MTRTSFYVLPDSDLDARTHFACRLADKAFRSGQRTLIWAQDGELAKKLDQRLWTWQPESFLPHSLLEAGLDSPVEITSELSADLASRLPHQILINLADRLPDAPGAFARIVEIVIQADPWRTQARERLKHYREQQFDVEVTDLRTR